jgi:hypothetical protein
MAKDLCKVTDDLVSTLEDLSAVEANLETFTNYPSAATDDRGAMIEDTSTELVDLVSMNKDPSTVAFDCRISKRDPNTVKN